MSTILYANEILVRHPKNDKAITDFIYVLADTDANQEGLSRLTISSLHGNLPRLSCQIRVGSSIYVPELQNDRFVAYNILTENISKLHLSFTMN